MKALSLMMAATTALSITTAAFAQPTDPGPEAEASPSSPVVSEPKLDAKPEAGGVGRPAEPRYDLVRVNLGMKVGFVPSRGFDTFAEDDALTQFSIDGTYPILTSGRIVLAAGVGWDVGARSDAVRGLPASLTAHRLYVPLEGRWNFAPWIYGLGKVSPGAAAMVADVKNVSPSGESLSATGWAFSADASVGASFLLGPRRHPEKRTIRFWATPEVGWAFTTNAPLSAGLGRAEEDVLGGDVDTNLRSLALSGFFWRASVGATF